MKKGQKIAVGVGIALFVIALILVFSNMSCDSKIDAKLKSVKASYADSIEISYNRGNEDGFNAGFNTGVKALDDSTAKYTEALATVQAALDDCQKGKKAPKKNKPINKTVAPQQKAPIVTKPNQFNPPQNTNQNQQVPQQKVQPQNTNETGTVTPASGISPYRSGYMCITVSEKGYKQYCLLKEHVDQYNGSGIPEFGYQGSKKYFSLTSDGKWWVYEDKKIVITDDYLSKNPFEYWAAYIGNEIGYPVYLPHEYLKPYILKGRGDLAGGITAEDMKNIGKELQGVADGTYSPNKILKDNDGYAHNDQRFYEGWRVRSQVIVNRK
jgi:hypothetical protein